MDLSQATESGDAARQHLDTDSNGATAGTGPYAAILEADPSLPTHTIYRPQLLEPFGRELRSCRS